MQVRALLRRWLVFLGRDAVRIGIGIVADAGHLPGDFDVRFVVFLW
jgi:hypothetical protein